MVKKIGCLLLVTAALGFSCVRDVQPAERGAHGAARRVLIAARESDFKRMLLDRVIALLGDKDYYFKIVGLDAVALEDASPYGAVVLMGTFMARRLESRAVDYARAHHGDPRLIVFYTQGAETTPSDGVRTALGCDVITSASGADRVGLKAEELAGLIRSRFK
ncbi:MAG: hypothetical protein JXD23_16885 [Spirochaetales bacterium]|nr:hypothetical protein [Spirochaetales bacterium]